MTDKSHPYAEHFNGLGRPQQYIGGEWNLIPADENLPRVTLVYPDIYELGMSNFGLAILRHLLEMSGEFDVRRAFCPAPDLDDLLEHESLPWVDLEGPDPVFESRAVGFTIPCESLYSNTLHLISRMGLPYRSKSRSEDSPIIVMGGGGLANPLPLSPFADLFFLGEVEEQAVELFRILAGRGTRSERLLAADSIPGTWIPGVSRGTVEMQRITSLRKEQAPVDQLVPISRVSQDRAVVEIARGCTRGCRFCQASQIYRPVRQRTPEEVLDLVDRSLSSTGWEKAGLLTLSLSDYSRLPELLQGMSDVTRRHHAQSSMPSMRPDSILRFGDRVDVTGRITLAPEAGTEELRRRMNKPISDETILEAVDSVFSMGARGIKLYFMIGLPGETEEDVRAIGDLAMEVAAICRRHGRNPRKSVSISLSPFVPKAQTPLQWAPQMKEEEIWRRIRLVRKACGKKVNLGWNSPRVALVEALLSIGGADTADVLEEAVRRGARYDAWSDRFEWNVWKEVISENNQLMDRLHGGIGLDESLPWDFVSTGVSKEHLMREYARYQDGTITEDCRQSGCHGCGACSEADGESRITVETATVKLAGNPPDGKRDPVHAVLRVRYSKLGLSAFTSHLDMVRMWGRVLRRAGLPLQWSDGYVSRPRVQFGPPLPLGVESEAEYLDIRLLHVPEGDPGAMLDKFMPSGFRVMETWIIDPGSPPPDDSPVAAEYEVASRDGKWKSEDVRRLSDGLKGKGAVLSADSFDDGRVRFLALADDKDGRPDRLLEDLIEKPPAVRRIEIYGESEEEGWRSIGSRSRDLEKMFFES